MQRFQHYFPAACIWLTLILFVFQLPYFFAAGLVKTISTVVHHLFVITWIVALFWKRFTLNPITAFKFWFIGVYTVMLVAIVLALPVAGIFGVDNGFVAGVWVPFTEEAAKILPVVLYFAYLSRTNRWQFCASDGLLLGFIVGFGFTFHEDAIRGGEFGSGWFASIFNAILPTINYHPGIMRLGHAGWTGFLGMATAFAFLYQGRRFARVLPLVVYGLVVLDHARCNMPAGFVLDSLELLLGHGYLVIVLFLIAIAAVFVVEGRILAEQERLDWLFSDVSMAKFPATGSLKFKLHMLRNLVDYRRLRRAVHYRFWLWRASRQTDYNKASEMANTLRQLALSLEISMDNKFEEALTLSIPADKIT